MSNQSTLARFAYNIYGSLNQNESPRQRTPDSTKTKSSKKLTYACEREIICVSQLRHPLGRLKSSFYDASAPVPAHHVVIGGKNYLKLLALSSDQTQIIADINLVDPSPQKRFAAAPKLFNVNTVKCNGDMVACGLTDGTVSIFQVSAAGKARLAHKFNDHKRVINSMDFVESDHILLSGSQDGTVMLWDLRTFNQKPVVKLRASQHSDPVRACQYSPHSRSRGKMTVLSVHDSGSLCKFDLRYPSPTSHSSLPERKWTFHTGPALSLHIHPEREWVLTGGRDRKLCLWDYEDTAAHHSISPKVTMNAYGPVMKVRWSDIPSVNRNHHGGFLPGSSASSRHSSMDISDDYGSPDPLFKYDFACSYLNDDPTISIYNLSRKYIPKEVITTSSGKPIQNFIWANNNQNERKLWTITKSNAFVSYNLTNNQENETNISRPLEEFTSIATAWTPGYTNIAFLNQDKNDFFLNPTETLGPEFDVSDMSAPYTDDLIASEEAIIDPLDYQSSSVSVDSKSKAMSVTASHGSSFVYYKSPKDRPSLVRSLTYNPSTQVFKSPSPIPSSHLGPLIEPGGTPGSYNPVPHSTQLSKPALTRNHSQSTQGSGSSSLFMPPSSSANSAFHMRKAGQVANFPSPYLISLNVPIPLNDESVFEFLSSEYYRTVPDGFALASICEMNAQAAASAQRPRDCQVWRMLAASIEQSSSSLVIKIEQNDNEMINEKEEDVAAHIMAEEAASINSDLGNLCGSYDSNSTSTTNFRSESGASVHNMAILSSSKETSSDFGAFSPSSASRLRRISPGKLGEEGPTPEIRSPVEPTVSTKMEDETKSEEKDKENKQSDTQAININNVPGEPRKSASMEALQPQLSISKELKRRTSYGAFPLSSSSRPLDIAPELFNESPTFLRRTSYSSSGYQASEGRFGSSVRSMQSRTRQSFSSTRASPVNPHYGFKPKSAEGFKGVSSQNAQEPLNVVEESSIKSTENFESGLTKAIQKHESARQNKDEEDEELDKPWSLTNLLAKAVAFARDEGDIVMCSTMVSLFYGRVKNFEEKVMSKMSCLECLGLYVDSLRRHELFAQATDVVKSAPVGLKKELSVYASREVDMRFFCCWCKKLLTNERTKTMYKEECPDKFGYWYCDECSRKQSNCVYCEEPCKGLTVVVGLKCGHSGHFGCLQEWFVTDENNECPAGCD